MKPAIRSIIIISLLLAIAGGAAAQQSSTATTKETPAAATSVTATGASSATSTNPAAASVAAEKAEEHSSNTTRNEFADVLRQHPPELGTILWLDPTLLSNDAFLTGYPALSQFVQAHPEVRRNPRFFLSSFEPAEPPRRGAAAEFFESLMILASFGLVAVALAWLLRTIVEQKRWNRLSRIQSEAHNKILDRFGTSEEVMAYLNTAPGRKFLEAAPIPLTSERAPQSAPVARLMWSVQFGVVTVAGAIGMLFVSGRFDVETARSLFAIGVIALCIGGGFIASAAVSLLLSRRIARWDTDAPLPANGFDDAERMR